MGAGVKLMSSLSFLPFLLPAFQLCASIVPCPLHAGIVLDSLAESAPGEEAAEGAEGAAKPKKVVYATKKNQNKKKEEEAKAKVGGWAKALVSLLAHGSVNEEALLCSRGAKRSRSRASGSTDKLDSEGGS